MNYTTRQNVENLLGKVYSEISTAEFNGYLLQTEAYINNYLGYNSITTSSGIMSESIVREKTPGKIDSFNNLVIDLLHPPMHFDSNMNPVVSLLEFNLGGIHIPLQLTDGSSSALNTLLEVSENGRKVVYPSLYFFPAISTVTPTAKVNLANLRDVKFFVDISYIGGYDIVPADITAAANLICGDMVTRRANPNFAINVKQGSYSVDFQPAKTTGKDVAPAYSKAHTLLQPYVRYTW